MAPIQILILMLMVRLPAEMAAADDHAATQPVLQSLPQWAWLILVSFFAAQLCLVLIFAQRARSSIRLLNSPTISASGVSSRMDHFMNLTRWATLVITGVYLFALHVPAILNHLLASTAILTHIPLLRELLYLLPALFAWTGCWCVNYFVESATRQRSFAYQLAQGRPVHEMPSMFHYLSMQLRHNLFLLVPIGTAIVIEEVADDLEPYVPHISQIAAPACVLTILLMAPWLITKIWTTIPLRGPLREKLDAVAGRYKLRFRNILIWKTHNAVTNAAILGYIPFSRYFLMTDALLETLTDQQIEAVFAHEVGHGVHRHILWYLFAGVGACVFSTGITTLCVHFMPVSILAVVGGENTTGMLIMFGLLALSGIFGFSFISHRFEHQADWFASKHMAVSVVESPKAVLVPASILAAPVDPIDDAAVQDPETVTLSEYVAGNYRHAAAATAAITSEPATPTTVSVTPTRAFSPQETGAEIFISSLDTIIELAHRSRSKSGWMHPSVNQRIELLRNLARKPDAEAAFSRLMVRTRVMVVVLFTVGLALAYWADAKMGPEKKPATVHQSSTMP